MKKLYEKKFLAGILIFCCIIGAVPEAGRTVWAQDVEALEVLEDFKIPEAQENPEESGYQEEAQTQEEPEVTEKSETIGELEHTEETETVEEFRSLAELSRELDAPLRIHSNVSGKVRAAQGSGEPSVEIGKSAHWLDIEEGYAQIDLTEKDTSVYSNQAIDYLIILDRTRTMSLNDTIFEGNSSNNINNSNSPCLNRNHYYEYEGRQLDLYDYSSGILRRTDQVMALPEQAAVYNFHRNESGAPIFVGYENGCMDRLSLAKDTICGLIDRIAANSPTENGAAKSRVSYWSFAGTYWPTQEGEIDTDPERGIFNYIPLTNDYAAGKRMVGETKTYAGTYYQESMKRAYEQLSERTGVYQNMPSKVIFISDGKCSDDFDEVRYWNNQLKSIPGCTVYTLAVGMPPASEGAVLLKNLSTNQNDTTFAAFTTNLNSSNPAFAETLAAIEQASVEVQAVQKVMRDKLDTRYWDFVEILSADGDVSYQDGTVTWRIPMGAGKTYRCSIKVRLKDKYRYLISDTSYPTNYDTEQGTGCKLEYAIRGGQYHTQRRTKEIKTPYLKYGTLKVEGEKHWTVEGAEAEQVALRLLRQAEGSSENQQVNDGNVTADKSWKFSFERRKVSGEERLPLVRYTNEEKHYRYWLEEDVPYYKLTEETSEEKDGILRMDLYNEPFKIRVRMEKQDAETKKRLSGAIFGVYAYSKKAQDYLPYRGDAKSVSGKEEMLLKEGEKGIYTSKDWLYYTPDNEGKFRIIEERPPKGYAGDYKDMEKPTEKLTYDVWITKDTTEKILTADEAGNPLLVKNTRIKGKLRLYKKDADSRLAVPQGNAVLFYGEEGLNARYGLFAGENIRHPDGVTAGEGKQAGILWEKDEQVAEGRISPEGFLTFENLDLGTYYAKELDTPPEGYLLDPTPYEVRLEASEDKCQLVSKELDAYEPVKKQSQTIYKVGGADENAEFEWVKGAGFSVIPLCELGEEDFGQMKDEEVQVYIDRKYRNPKTLTYESMKDLPTVLLYEDGREVQLPELIGTEGIIKTPPLPYGDYAIVETTVPKGKRPVRPLIVRIRDDENDGEVKGDGKGTKREAKVLRDKDVLSNVRIVKADAASKEPLNQGQAAYVILDVEGSFKERYLKKASLWEKAEYLLKYNGLVIETDKASETVIGTYEHPFRTKEMVLEGKTLVAALTREGLPEGMYELREVEAPKGYILQGREGCIAKNRDLTIGNQTFYETEETGKWTDTPSDPVRFVVGDEHSVYDEKSDCWWTEVIQENMPAIGKLSILAEAEQYVPSGKVVRVPQKKAEFELYAGDEMVERFVTDEKGKAWSGSRDGADGNPKGLPLGTYRLVQTKAGEGFALPDACETREVLIEYKDSKTPVVYRDECFLLPAETPDKTGPEEPSAPEPMDRPKTGDHAQPLALLLAGLASAGILIRIRRRMHR